MEHSPGVSLPPQQGGGPSPLWLPVATVSAIVAVLLLVVPTVGPMVTVAAGSVTALLGIAALQRTRSRTRAARSSLAVLVVGLLVMGLGAALGG
jgi:hypothetical protein